MSIFAPERLYYLLRLKLRKRCHITRGTMHTRLQQSRCLNSSLHHILSLSPVFKAKVKWTMTLHNINLSVDLNTSQAYTILTPCITLETALSSRAALSMATRRAQLGLCTMLRVDRSEKKRLFCRAIIPRQIVFAIQGTSARQCAPSFRPDALLCAGILRS